MAENNVLIKIRGEVDLAEAQIQLQDMTDKSKRLRQEMDDLTAAERHMQQQQRQSVEAGKQEDAALAKLIEEHRQLRKECQQEIDVVNKNIQSLKQSISSHAAMQGECKRTSLQVRAIREELMKMEMAGDTTSQRFIDLSVEAARLTDQIGDTQQQVRILASDTANLDAAMSLGSGLAGAFTTASAAAALLGGENEALEKSFLQVQAAMAVLNGVQQVANALNKDSAANVVIRNALNKLFTKSKVEEAAATGAASAASVADAGAKAAQTAATNTATTATNRFTAALLKNPAAIIVVAIAALVASLVVLHETTKKNEERQRDFNGELERTKSLMGQLASDADYAARMAEAEGKSQEEILKIKTDAARRQKELADKSYDEQLAKAAGHWDDMSDEEKQFFEESKKLADDAWNAYNALLQEGTILAAKQRREAAEEAERQQKEEAAKAAEIAKQRNAEIIAAEKELAAAKIRVMKESKGKALLEIGNEYQEKIKAIKGNSKAEQELRKTLLIEMQQRQQEVSDQWNEKKLTAAYELAKKINETELSQTEKGTQQYEHLLKQRYEVDVKYANDTIKNAEELNAELDRLAAELESKLNDSQASAAANRIANWKKTADNRVAEEENAALRILINEKSTNAEREAAAKVLADHQTKINANREEELVKLRDEGLISEEDYQTEMLALERERLEQSKAQLEAHAAMAQQLATEVLGFVGDMASTIFGAIKDNLSQQMDDLDNLYTTDAEEAKNSADKKYITEKELAAKKLAIKQKQAKIEKAEAAFSIGISTATAIMRAWAESTVAAPILTALIAALGATQLAIVLSKPLPQYAKGRKGGQGEYAMVGEKGAELMYIPQGASIVPHDKVNNPAAWAAYGVPALPNFESFPAAAVSEGIDYDRLGKAVADNLPKQKAVSVNVDRNGILVSEDYGSTIYLNKKYTGVWI